GSRLSLPPIHSSPSAHDTNDQEQFQERLHVFSRLAPRCTSAGQLDSILSVFDLLRPEILGLVMVLSAPLAIGRSRRGRNSTLRAPGTSRDATGFPGPWRSCSPVAL